MRTDSLVRVGCAIVLCSVLGAAPASGALISELDAPSTRDADDVAVVGDYAYLVTDSDNGTGAELYVVDLKPLTHPTVVGSLNIGSTVAKVRVSGTRAYLATADNSRELAIVDVSNPTAPAIIGGYDTAETTNGTALAVSGTTVYLGTKLNSGANHPEFYVLDASNPSAVALLGSYDVGGNVNDIAFDGLHALLATSVPSKEFMVLNVTTPSAITLGGSVDLPGTSIGRGVAVDLALARLYGVTDNQGAQADFYVWTVSPSGTLTAVGSVDLNSSNRGVAVYGGRAFVSSTNYTTGLTVVDVSGATPVEITAFNTGAAGAGVTTRNEVAFVATADNAGELQIYSGTALPVDPPVALLSDPTFVPVSITGAGMGDGTGSSLVFTQGNQTLTVAAGTACTTQVPTSCIISWANDWISAKLPPTWTSASVQVVTGAAAGARSDALRIQYYALDYRSTVISPQADPNGSPLALAADPADPLHRVWLNDEASHVFKSFTPGASAGVALVPLFPGADQAHGPFFTKYAACPTCPPFPTQNDTSQSNEDVIIDPYDRVWFDEGGWGVPDPGYYNRSRVVMYRWDPSNPGTIAETRVYNLPGDDVEVYALAYEQNYVPGKDRVWYSAPVRKPQGSLYNYLPARLGWFDPEEPGLAHDGTRDWPVTPGSCVASPCSTGGFPCCSGHPTRACYDDFDCSLSDDVCWSDESPPGCKFHEYKLPSTIIPAHLEVGPDHAIWWAEYWGASNLGRLDPTGAGTLTLYPTGDDPSRGGTGLFGSNPWKVVVADGNVVVNEYTDLTIDRFDTSRVGDTACTTLVGYRNPCMTSVYLPADASLYNNHEIFPDSKNNIWFDMNGPFTATSKTTVGYVKRDWKNPIMFPPLVVFVANPNDGCSFGDPGSGVTVDRSNDHVWFGDYCRQRMGHLQPTNVNLALGKSATESSTFCFLGACGYASSAVDGDTDGNFYDGSVAHTYDSNKPWWQVDLGASHALQDVEVWNRTDCCGDRLQDFDVFVSDNPFTSTNPAVVAATPGVMTIHQVAAPGNRFLAAVNRSGRYVRVQLLGTTQPLQLGEVVIVGAP